MTDYQIQPNTRHCAATGRELRPGEKFYSVLLQEGGKLIRHDYAAEAWHGPPEEVRAPWSHVIWRLRSRVARIAPAAKMNKDAWRYEYIIDWD